MLVQRLPHAAGLPRYVTAGAAGCDLAAAVPCRRAAGAGARREGAGADRPGAGAGAGLRGAGPAPLRPGPPSRRDRAQRARAPSTRTTEARCSCCWSTSATSRVAIERGMRIAQMVVAAGHPRPLRPRRGFGVNRSRAGRLRLDRRRVTPRAVNPRIGASAPQHLEAGALDQALPSRHRVDRPRARARGRGGRRRRTGRHRPGRGS